MFDDVWGVMFIILGFYLLSGPILGIVGMVRAGRALQEAENLRREVARLAAHLPDAPEMPPAVSFLLPERPEKPEPPQQSATTAEPAPQDEPAAEDAAPAEPSRGKASDDAVQAPSEALPQPPAAVKPTWEQHLTSGWMLWLGGIALALGGAFLVKVTIDAGLLTPVVRCVLGVVLGLGLAIGGEVLRRRPLQRAIAAVAPNHLPPALSAAGVAILFASIYSAHALYGLIGAPFAFLLLAVVAFVAVGLSLLQGPFVALLGLLGGFITPFVVASHEPSALSHFGYLFALTAGALAVARYRAWTLIAALALAGALGWALLWMAAIWHTGDTLVLAVYLLALAGAAVFCRHGLFALVQEASAWAEAKGWDRLVQLDRLISLAALGIAFGAFALLRLDHYGPVSLAALLLLSAFYLFSGRRIAQLEALPVIAALLCLAALASWHLPQFVSGPQPLVVLDGVPLGELRSPILPPSLVSFAVTGGLAAALFWLTGYGFLWGAKKPAYWALLSAVTPLALLVVAYWRIADFELSLPWAGLALALAALALLAAHRLVQREPELRHHGGRLSGALAVYAVAVISGLTLAMTMQLREAWLTVALALQLPATAWVARQVEVKALRTSALVLAIAVLLRLIFNQTILAGTPVGAPLVNWLLYGYGLPALAFWLAAREFRRERDDALVVVLEAGALLFTVLLISFEIRSFFNEGVVGAQAYSLAEQATQGLAWLGLAVGLLRLHARHRRPVLLWGARCLGGISFANAILGPVGLSNPLFTGAPIGDWPLFNLLSLAYLAPAALALLYAWIADRQGERLVALGASAMAVLLIFIDLSLEIRHGFHGSRLDLGPTTDLEWYAYSLGWLCYAGALLALAILSRRAALRYVSLTILLLTVGKVFLFDMAALTGLYRALSFLGLGASLLAIGYLYQRFVFPKPPVPEPGGKGELPMESS